jgi:hypothetical protein
LPGGSVWTPRNWRGNGWREANLNVKFKDVFIQVDGQQRLLLSAFIANPDFQRSQTFGQLPDARSTLTSHDGPD